MDVQLVRNKPDSRFLVISSQVPRAELGAVVQVLESLEKESYETGAALRQLAARLDAQLTSLSDLRQVITEMVQAVPQVELFKRPTVTEAPLRIYCLGAFAVFAGDQQIALKRTSKDGQILKYLATTGRKPVKRDVLLEVLWPDTDPQVANNRLKVTIHHLRQLLDPVLPDGACGECVVFEHGSYMLNPEMRIWTDVQEFEDNWQTGSKFERAGRMEEAIAAYSKAESLYRGDFLQEDMLEEWTLVKREALKDTHLEILDKLSQYYFRASQIDAAIAGWKKIIVQDPWREDAYRSLMICFAALGQRARALKWYETCVQTLRLQLGIDPEPETVELSERIRAGEATLLSPHPSGDRVSLTAN